jgi:nicotinamide mononucleotide transporter
VAAFWSSIADQAQSMIALEIIAVVTAIAYLLLAVRQNIWCWFCAAISTAIYVYLFVVAKLYMESALNIFYFAMAIYGWHVWSSGSAGDSELPVTTWPVRVHIRVVVGIAVISSINGFLLDNYTDAEFPYVDSLTTWSAIWATFLVARKVFENWWYWLVIDIASVYIYWSRELELTSLLFVIYVVIIPFGMMSWRGSLREQPA